MMDKKKTGTMLFMLMGLFVIIMDAKTSLEGANNGLEICLKTVIPSLFPFLVLTNYINAHLAGKRIPCLQGLCRLLGIPRGAESALLLGLLGGYPAGAQCISQFYHNRTISDNTAKRMLGFCNNAGPAFIFGMTGFLFSKPAAPWLIWISQVISALSVGILLPNKEDSVCHAERTSNVNISAAVEGGIRTICIICGWVILFRIFAAFLIKWFLWMFSREMQAIIVGVIELANGCYELQYIPHDGLRFILCSGLLSLGGISVMMQTRSICGRLGTGAYLTGKVLQCAISLTVAYWMQLFLFPQPLRSPVFLCITIAIIASMYAFTILMKRKKVVVIPA